MLFKLLSLLGAGKGGVVAAAAIVAGVSTVNVASMPEFQEGLREVVAAVSTVTSPGMSQLKNGLGCGQPVVVAQRNAADKLLRAAYHEEHRRLSDLRGGQKGVDRQALNNLVGTAAEDLRTELRTALNEVAELTLGREGLFKESRDGATPTASPAPEETPEPDDEDGSKPECAPSSTPDPDATPAPEGSPSLEERGRVAVANRVTLDPALAEIIEAAKTEMKRIVDDTETAAGELEPVERGKPEDKGKPGADATTERGKPDGKPSTPPGRSR